MKMNDLFPSKYLKTGDVSGKGETYTIEKLEVEKFKDKEGDEATKPVLYFKGEKKGLVLNKTNAARLSEKFGDESDGWAGKKIVLRLESVEAFGKMQDSIRIKV